MNTARKLPKILLGATAALVATAATAQASAACTVTDPQDDLSTQHTLRYCVTQSNDPNITITASHWYELNSPLVITRSVTITDNSSSLILPGDAFTGVNLIQIGSSTAVSVTLTQLEIAAVDFTGIRGILVQPSSTLVGSSLFVSGFDNSLDGGAIRAEARSSVTLNGSTISDNAAARGGAIFSLAGVLNIEDSTLADNSVTGSGGAVFVDTASPADPKVVHVDASEFLRNHATSNGGAIDALSGTAGIVTTISKTDFIDNSASVGGAVRGGATITDSFFQANAATTGGALGLVSSSTLRRNSFFGNSAATGGGVSFIASGAGAVLSLEDSMFNKNKLVLGNGSSGGGVFISGGATTHTVANCTFYANGALGTTPSTQTRGGAIAVAGGARADVIHSTLSDNAANVGGGVLANNATIKIWSSVVAQSSGGGNCFNAGGTLTQSTSLSSDGSCAMTYNNTNPQLASPASNGGPTLTMKPQSGSRLINNGECYRPSDQRGAARPAVKCDIGSVEL